jgi:D-erythronate 2-dehydrogenase
VSIRAIITGGAAEADFDLGMRVNVDGTRAVLERARRQAEPPVLVFSSSLAVFGTDPAAGTAGTVPDTVHDDTLRDDTVRDDTVHDDTVRDDTLPRPQSSHGIQKFVGEQFVADYSRRGFVRGRSVRLMTVAVRPGKPNAAASSFVSGIIREPLAGQRAACPVPADTPIALSSPSRTLDAILRAAAADEATGGATTALNLPGLTTTPRSMAEAMDRVAGRDASQFIDWTDDPAIGTIVRSWPARFDTARAHALGLEADQSFDDVVREYISERGNA